MSDAALAMFVRVILSQLRIGIDTVREGLPDDMKVQLGKEGSLFDPLRTDYPILYPLENIIADLETGLKELEKPKGGTFRIQT